MRSQQARKASKIPLSKAGDETDRSPLGYLVRGPAFRNAMDHDGVPGGNLFGEPLHAVKAIFKTDPNSVQGGTVERFEHLRDDAVLTRCFVWEHAGAGLKKEEGWKVNLLRRAVQPRGRQGTLQGGKAHVFFVVRLKLGGKKRRVKGLNNLRGPGLRVIGTFAPGEGEPGHLARGSAVGASKRKSLAGEVLAKRRLAAQFRRLL